MRHGFTEGSANGYVVTKTSSRSAFHAQIEEVEWATNAELTASVPACLQLLEPTNDVHKMRSAFSLLARAMLSPCACKASARLTHPLSQPIECP
jgi:hypothetical protein